jgi:hypothetical protein
VTKYDGTDFNRRWHEAHDESKLCIWIKVDQVTGTTGIFERVEHYARPDEEKTRLATIHSDAKDGSPEAKMEILMALLVLHANRVARASELGVEPF